jgi:hypothetical protein
MPISPEREAEIRAIYEIIDDPERLPHSIAHARDPTIPWSERKLPPGVVRGEEAVDDAEGAEPDYDSDEFRKRYEENAPVYVAQFFRVVRNESDDTEDKDVKDE